jgi:hypothetical protein
MKLAAISKARALTMIELDELNVGGKVRLLDCVAPIVERYKFAVFPQKAEDFDLGEKGVRFEAGKAGDLTIDSLVIYSGAILVDTFSSTSDSQGILLGMLEWGREALGLTYTPGMLKKWGYISQILFYTDFPLLAAVSPALRNLALKTSSVTEGLFGGLVYEPVNISIGHDPMARKHGIASFYIQHRVNALFSENKYFSEAPLPTDLHIKFLEEFESDIMESLE